MISIAFNRLCLFYRDSRNTGYYVGYCDLDNCLTVCDGNLALCEKPNDPRNYQNRDNKDRRRYPRFDLDLPLEHKVMGTPTAFGGIAINGSEEGLLIFSPKDMLTATKLKIVVFFPNRYELGSFEVFGEITRQEVQYTENRKGFQYGLKFIRVLEEDHRKLRNLLSGLLAMEEASDRLRSELSLDV